MESPNKTTPHRNSIFSRLFTRRMARRLLIGLAWAVTLFALFHAEENWRGRRAWNEYRQSMEAKGESFDIRQMIPKEVPNEQNFAAIPVIKSWFQKFASTNDPYAKSDHYDKASRNFPVQKEARRERKFNDLVAWKDAFNGIKVTNALTNSHLDAKSRAEAAPAVLKALNESVSLAELKAAGSRPYARYPIVWDLENPWGILLPHLARVKGACLRLQLKASAELALNNTDAAMDDIKLALYLCDTVKDEPLLISYLVRIASFQLATQPVWEGLQEHRWSDTQLKQLQSTFQNYDLLRDLKPALDGERAFGAMTPPLIRKKGLSELLSMTDNSTFPKTVVDVVGFVAPRGWYNFEQLTYCQLFEMQSDNTIDWQKRTVSPINVQANSDKVSHVLTDGGLSGQIFQHRIISCILLPALNRIPAKTAAGQTTADQAVLACALERYRLANGKFPEKLEALLPTFLNQLPHDLVTGDSYKYRLNDDGSFLLYSVGWNGKDDGGTPGKVEFDEKNGDWVWGRSGGSINPVFWRQDEPQK